MRARVLVLAWGGLVLGACATAPTVAGLGEAGPAAVLASPASPCLNAPVAPTEPMVLAAQDAAATRAAGSGWPEFESLAAWVFRAGQAVAVAQDGRVVRTDAPSGAAPEVPGQSGLKLRRAVAHPTDGSLWGLDESGLVLWRLGAGEKAWRAAWGGAAGEALPQGMRQDFKAELLVWDRAGGLWVQGGQAGALWRWQSEGAWRLVHAQAPSFDLLLPSGEAGLLGRDGQGGLHEVALAGVSASPWSQVYVSGALLATRPDGSLARLLRSGQRGEWSVSTYASGKSEGKFLLEAMAKSRAPGGYTLLCSGDPNERAFPLDEQPFALMGEGKHWLVLTTKGVLRLPG